MSGPIRSADDSKQQIDIYKIRIEEYDRNYFSLRDLEWRTALQFLSGYIAIGVGYHQLRPKDGAPDLLLWWCAGLTTLLFIAFVFFRLCVHQRLTWVRERRNDYLKKLHELQPDTKNPYEENFTPWARGWYALAVQLIVHVSAFLSVLGFIIATRKGPFG